MDFLAHISKRIKKYSREKENLGNTIWKFCGKLLLAILELVISFWNVR